MTCAASDGWFAVAESEWLGYPVDNTRVGGCLLIVGRCRIYAPLFEASVPCADGLIVEDHAGERFGLYWRKNDRAFVLVPMRPHV